MAKRRVYEIAKELGIESKDLIKKLQDVGVELKSHSSTVDDDDLKRALAGPAAKKPEGRRLPGMVVRKKADIPVQPEPAPTEVDDFVATESVESHFGSEPREERYERFEEHRDASFSESAATHMNTAAEAGEQRLSAQAAEGISGAVSAGSAAEIPHEPSQRAVAHPHAEAQAPREPTAGASSSAQAPTRPQDPGAPAKPAGAPPTGARVVRMIDRDKLISRIPPRRAPGGGGAPGRFQGGPGGNRPLGGGPGGRPSTGFGPSRFGPRPGPGSLDPQMPGPARFGPVKELRVVSDAFGKGREMIDVAKEKKKGASKTEGGKREKLDKRSLLAMHERNASQSRLKRKRGLKRSSAMQPATVMKASKRVIHMMESMTVADLAKELSVKATDIIRKLMELGQPATINQALDFDTVSLVAQAYEYKVESGVFQEAEFFEEEGEVNDADLKPRPPIVTVMGHVDHGKTSLLDAIRQANVAEGEAGGITQHIGAYSVETEKGRITFLDTPGHEAFTAMRARGAKLTDIVVLVVAADDGPMPQTIEAIRHAQAAEVPIIVAINKIDKPGAKPDQIQQALTEFSLVPEEWGGDTMVVKTSATKKTGINELLDAILLQAEVLELRANPDKRASGTVVEARLDKGLGPRVTVIVQDGTIHVGDPVVVGDYYGKVRALFDSRGQALKEAGPSTPTEIIGLDGVPDASDQFNVVENLDDAKAVAEHRTEAARTSDLSKRTPKVTLEDLYAKLKGGAAAKELKVIIKADVQGSVEALSEALRKLSTAEVSLTIIHSAVGAVTEGDVMLGSAAGAVIICFNVKPDAKTKALAENEGVEIKTYNIIYNALDEVRKAMGGLLTPTTQEKMSGRAEVRQVFSAPKIGVVAGCAVVEGKVTRSSRVRLFRDSKQIHDGKVATLKRFKDDVREVQQGFECGIVIEGFTDVKVGDVIECYEIETVARSLDAAPAANARSVGGPGRPSGGVNASPQ